MIKLYHGTGSQQIEILGPTMFTREWDQLRGNVSRLLTARKHTTATELLNQLPFEIREGTNWFGDEFSVLYWLAPLEKYVEVVAWVEDPPKHRDFALIAKSVSEIGPHLKGPRSSYCPRFPPRSVMGYSQYAHLRDFSMDWQKRHPTAENGAEHRGRTGRTGNNRILPNKCNNLR